MATNTLENFILFLQTNSSRR